MVAKRDQMEFTMTQKAFVVDAFTVNKVFTNDFIVL